MWSEPVSIGLGLDLTGSQLVVLVGFIGLVIGYLLAWSLNRRRQGFGPGDVAAEKERAAGNVAFMKGINYILSDKHDKAIEELTRAVSVDTETVETYVALGNLFRKNGEIDRAIRIRQSIIVRPNIADKIKLQAMFDLGLDFRRAGFYERAIKAFEEVLAANPKKTEAYNQLVLIYEETRDWENAFNAAEKLAKLTGRRDTHVLAHYQVEIGKNLFEQGRLGPAKSAYKKAFGLDPGCVDAYLHLGDLHLSEGKHKKAVGVWRKVVETVPEMSFLTYGRLGRVAAEMKDFKPVEQFLNDMAAAQNNSLAHLAHLTLARLLSEKGRPDQAVMELRKALALDPGSVEAHRELGILLLSLGQEEDALAAYRLLLANLQSPEAAFQCSQCGFESNDLMWRCPQCGCWDAMTLRRNAPQLFDPVQPILLPEPARAEAPDTTDADEEGEESDSEGQEETQ